MDDLAMDNPNQALSLFSKLIKQLRTNLGDAKVNQAYNEFMRKSQTSMDMEAEETYNTGVSDSEEEDGPVTGLTSDENGETSSDTSFIEVKRKSNKRPKSPPQQLQDVTKKRKEEGTMQKNDNLQPAGKPPAAVQSQPTTSSAIPTPKPVEIQKDTNTNTKKAKIPPIICYSCNVAQIGKFCRAQRLIYDVKNKSDTTIIQAGNRESYDIIRNYLKQECMEFNTFTPREDRKNLLLLKGIHHSYTAIEVEDELRIEGLPIVKVTPFKPPRNNAKEVNSFVVELDKTCDIREVYTKTLIMNQRVHWERLKSIDIVQCRNCQQLGHVASNCGRKYVCVKCKEDHKPGQCQRKDNVERTTVWCANCKKEGHPANYKGCPIIKAKLAQKKKKAAEKRAQHALAAKSVHTYVQPGIDYAAMTKGLGANKPRQQAPAAAPKPAQPAAAKRPSIRVIPRKENPEATPIDINGEAKRLFGSDLLTLIRNAKNAVPSNYAQLSEDEKRVAFATIILQICL